MTEIHFPFSDIPAPDQALEVAPQVLWLRQTLPWALDHVNVYALDEGDGWTIIDPGLYTEATLAQWQAWLAGPLAGKKVRRVLVTHHHPDHVGMAGWFHAQGAEIIMTRVAWLFARMMQLDAPLRPTAEQLAFWHRAGVDAVELARRADLPPINLAHDCVAALPLGFTRISESDVFESAGRCWQVRLGSGHAPDHATLWSDDLVVAGDQILPRISPNIGVQASEPEADPLADWLEAARRFSHFASEQHLVLPGHNTPFFGLPHRLAMMVSKHEAALARLLGHLQTPHLATGCFSALFKRRIGPSDLNLALAETMAHLNYLYKRGKLRRELNMDGQYLWQAICSD